MDNACVLMKSLRRILYNSHHISYEIKDCDRVTIHCLRNEAQYWNLSDLKNYTICFGEVKV